MVKEINNYIILKNWDRIDIVPLDSNFEESQKNMMFDILDDF